MRNYMKRKQNMNEFEILVDEVLAPRRTFGGKKLFVGLVLVIAAVMSVRALNAISIASGLSAESGKEVKLAKAPVAVAAVQRSKIEIPKSMVKANPFLPYRNIEGNSLVDDIPAYNLVEPPEALPKNSDAVRVMNVVVSGILYDKYSPSAILNIEGSDYLVKKNDVINNYKVLNIAHDSVTVMLGENSYQAGIGEILTEGSIKYNEVSNLNNKFGGKNNE